MWTKISYGFFLLSFGLIVWGGVRLASTENESPAGNTLVIEPTQFDLGEQPLGFHVLELRFRNPGSRPLRILGIRAG